MRSRGSASAAGRRRRAMGGIARRPLLVGLALAMVLGFAVYFRLWTIDYSLSSNDTELIRKEFDLAHREAMDESAEWRRQYDLQVERASTCERELREAKKEEGSTDINVKLSALQKENAALQKKLGMLNDELKAEKLKCRLKELH